VTAEPDIRSVREERWRAKVAADACWFIDQPTPELASVLASWSNPEADRALDVGCGPGTITIHLAERFGMAVGFDVAAGAVEEGRKRAAGSNSPPTFLLAEAPWLPFRDGAFGLIFDRGVLHHVPRGRWGTYFREVTRVLRPGGVYLQYCPQRVAPPLLSYRGLRRRVGRIVRPKPSVGEAMRAAAPKSLVPAEVRDFPFESRTGQHLVFTFGMFHKVEEPPR